jgi:CRP-like cAMP-binding protein
MVDSKTLQNYSFFGGIPAEEIEKILPLMEQETLESGAEIICEGKPNDKIYFITQGKVEVTREGALLSELGEGSTFGEMEVLDVMPAEATVKAKTRVSAFSMSNRTLREIYRQDLKSFSLVMMNLARDLSRRLRAADEKIASLRQHLP